MFNAEKTISDTLASALGQDYPNLEVIVVNDGSSDGSRAIVENFMERFPNILTLLDQENAGVSVARNRGIEAATGEYVAFLDSDDRWANTKVSRQVEIMESFSDIYLLGTATTRKSRCSGLLIPVDFRKLLFKNYFVTSSVILRREVLNDVGYFNCGQRYSEDYDLWLRIAKNYRSAVLDEPLTYYSRETPGLSRQLWRMQVGELTNFQHLYQSGAIGLATFLLVVMVSLLKFVRRLVFSVLGKWRIGAITQFNATSE